MLNHNDKHINLILDSLPKGALCMKLVITKSGSSFETENCNNHLKSLCCKYLYHFNSRSVHRTVSSNM